MTHKIHNPIENNEFKMVQQTYAEALRMDANVCRLERKAYATKKEIIECRKLFDERYNIFKLYE